MRASHYFHDQLNSHLLVLLGDTCSSLWGGCTRYFSSTPNRVLPVKKNTCWRRRKPLHFSNPVRAPYLPLRSSPVSAAMMPSSAPCRHSSAKLRIPFPFPACPLLRPRPVLAHQLHRWLASGASAQLLSLTRLWGTARFLDLRPNFSRSHSLCGYVVANLAKS